MPLFCGPRGRMLAATGAEACLSGLAIVAMIDFSPWSGGVLWRLTALCRALRTPGTLLDSRIDIIRCSIWRVRQVSLDIQSFAGWSGERRCV